MNADIGWGVLIGAVGLLGLEAISLIAVAIVAASRRVKQQPQPKTSHPPGLRVVDGGTIKGD